MDYKYSGKAIIFKNEIFPLEKDLPKADIGLDCSKLEVSLKKLGFDVTIYADLTLEELFETVENCMYMFIKPFFFIHNNIKLFNIYLIVYYWYSYYYFYNYSYNIIFSLL